MFNKLFRSIFLDPRKAIVACFATIVVTFAAISIAQPIESQVLLVPMASVQADPVAHIGQGIYLVRMTTVVNTKILGRQVPLPQVAYIRLTAKQIKIVRGRIDDAKKD